MEEMKVRGIKKVAGSEMDSQTLKSMLYGDAFPAIVSKERREFPGKEVLFEPVRWSGLSEAISESELVKGLKFGDELSDVKRQVDGLISEVESVKSELKQCKEGISTILNELREKPITKQTELFEIGGTLEVIRPIPVVIEEYSDEVIATFPEIEAFGAGLCEAEAIIDLKNEIRKIFFELEGVGDNELGKLPLSWKRVLLKVVKKIGKAQ